MNIINIEHITKRFGDKFLFEDASFGVQEGDKIGIVGINGTGKSTLLKMIAGKEETDEGQIVRQNGKKTAYLPQNPEFPKDADLADALSQSNPDMDWKVQSNLTRLGITDYKEKIDALSGGQRRKAALAKILAEDVDIFCWMSPPIIWMKK